MWVVPFNIIFSYIINIINNHKYKNPGKYYYKPCRRKYIFEFYTDKLKKITSRTKEKKNSIKSDSIVHNTSNIS